MDNVPMVKPTDWCFKTLSVLIFSISAWLTFWLENLLQGLLSSVFSGISPSTHRMPAVLSVGVTPPMTGYHGIP
jgi:hypothetical protein